MEVDAHFALFIFIFLFSSVFIFATYRISVFTILFAGTVGYLYYLAYNGKISTKELFEMSLIPVGFMLAPLVLIIMVFGAPLTMLLTEGITEELLNAQKY
jgi:predicted membrane protein